MAERKDKGKDKSKGAKSAKEVKESKAKASAPAPAPAPAPSPAPVEASAPAPLTPAQRNRLEAEARKAEAAKRREAELARLAAEKAKALEAKAQREAERQAARQAAKQTAQERSAAMRQRNEELRAERLAARQTAKPAERPTPTARPKAITHEAKPVKTGKVAAVAPKAEAVPFHLSFSMPPAVQKALATAVDAASGGMATQLEGYLKPSHDQGPKGLDRRVRQFAKQLLGAVRNVTLGLLSGAPEGSPEAVFLPEKARVAATWPNLSLDPTLKRGLNATLRGLAEELGALASTYPALGSPIMLQGFADLSTGQSLDITTTFTANAAEPGLSEFGYVVLLGPSSKRQVAPTLKLTFSHNLALSKGGGSLTGSFPVAVPEAEVKN